MSYMHKLVWRQEDALLLPSAEQSEVVPLTSTMSPEVDIWRLNCITEVVPGLYLTCKEQMMDKVACAKRGIALVIDLCATNTTPQYAVVEVVGDDAGNVQSVSVTREAFLQQLDAYTSLSSSTASPRVFVRSVAALDLPTYDLSQHLPELCAVLQLVAFNREQVERRNDDAGRAVHGPLPAASVHCLLGVSRSATVVIAYLMKRLRLPCDDILGLVRGRRPAVNPNPGFMQQLLLWERMSCMRVTDAWSAELLAVELRYHRNLAQIWPPLVMQMLTNAHCGCERSHVGELVRAMQPTSDELHSLFCVLRECLVNGMKGDLHVDVPCFFDNACEVVASIDQGYPVLWQTTLNEHRDATIDSSGVVFSDELVGDMCVAACEGRGVGDARDVVSVMTKLVAALRRSCHGNVLHPHAYAKVVGNIVTPSCLCTSFPVLLLVAPFAEGIMSTTMLSELQCALNEAALVTEQNATITALAERVLCDFISVLCDCESGRGSLGDAANGAGDKEENIALSTARLHGTTTDIRNAPTASLLAHICHDIEIIAYLGCARGTAHDIVAEVEHQLGTVEHAGLGCVVARKVAAGVVAFRLVLSAAVNFVRRVCVHATVLDALCARAERYLSLTELQMTLDAIGATYEKRYRTPLLLAPYIARLLLCLDEDVVPRHGDVAEYFARDIAAERHCDC